MKKWVFVVIITFSFQILFSQNKIEVSLKEAHKMAIDNYRLYQNELREQQKVGFQTQQTRITRLPQIYTTADLTRNLIRPITILPGELANRPGENIPVQFGTNWENTVALDFYVNLFNPLTKQDLKNLELKKAQSVVQAQLLKEELQLVVTRSYYNILISQARLDQQQKNLIRLQKNLTDTQIMVDAGFLNAIEIERFKNSINNIKTTIRQTQQTVELSQQNLNYYLGLPLEQELVLSDAILPMDKPEVSISVATMPPVNQLAAFQLKELLVQQAAANIIRQKKTAIPVVAIHGRMGTQALGNKLKYFDEQKIPWYFSAYVGIGVNWQLNTLWNNRHAMPVAQLELEQAKALQEAEKEALSLRYIQAKNDFDNAIENLSIAKSNIDFAQKELQYVQTRFEGELVTGKDLMEAENTLQSSQDEYWIAVYMLLESQAALEKAVGKH